MNKLIAALLACCLISVAHARDEAKVTYVGGGRNACSGDSYKCARVEQENQRESDRRSREYQRDQDRAQDYVDRERRRDAERREEQYRNR